MPLVALGHSLGDLESSLALDGGIFSENVGNHAVLKRLDDTGDVEKQRPQTYLDNQPEHDKTYAEELLERNKQLGKARLAASADHEESVGAYRQRNHKEERDKTVQTAVDGISGAEGLAHHLLHFGFRCAILNLGERFLCFQHFAAGEGIHYLQQAIRYCRADQADNNERQQIFPEAAFKSSLGVGLEFFS